MTEGLTPDDVALLRRPYHTNAVKWLPIGKLTANGVNMMPHIDASLVIERLSDVDPGWSEDTVPMLAGNDTNDPFGLAHQSPWRCTLTVKGTTRHGVGQLDAMSSKPDGKHLKAGESDALKRAALKFGVGAYLRAIPLTWLPRQHGGKDTVKEYNGKFTGLTPTGKAVLRAQYEKIVQHASFVEHYGAMIDYGDMADDSEDHVVLAEQGGASDGEMNVLVLLSGYTGRDTSEDYVRTTYEGKPFAKSLAALLTAVRAHLEVNATDVDRLRTLAQAAAGGDDGAMGELGEGLVQLKALASAGEPEGEAEQEAMPV